MKIRDQIVQFVKDSIDAAIREGDFPEEMRSLEVKVGYPKEQRFGDYATPIALEAARLLRRSPMEIGETLSSYIKKESMIQMVEVAKPGFVNIFISEKFLFQNCARILSEVDEYGKSTKENPRRINLEFVSANPTGPMNIVSARAAALGDTLANLLQANGDVVDREFYVNDYGNQVRLLGLSVFARYKELAGEPVSFPEDGYHGEYVRDIAQHVMDEHGDTLSSMDEDEAVSFMADRAVEYNLERQRKDLERFNVHFKTWFREKSLHEEGNVEQVRAILQKKNVLFEEGGKTFFRSTDFGDDKDRVVVRDDGRPTYLLADIAYHNNKINRGYDTLIDIWGPDHHGYIARLSGAVEALGFEPSRFRVLIAQQVNLIEKGEAVKMSKRLGKFSTMHELIEEIGADVARYFFVMRSMDSHLDFDLTLAKKESSENPVFYLQYAYARISSIFREAEKRGIALDTEIASVEHLNNREAEILMKLLMKFPEEVADAAQTYEPHRICTFLMRLAQAFHKFYTEHRILADNPARTSSALLLARAVHIVMKNGLGLIGVDAPERM